MMDKSEFAERLTTLRMQKGVSARDMSLSIGQSAGYINNIENGVNLPSMSVFFYICDYLEISPRDFFDISVVNPTKAKRLYEACRNLSDSQMEHLIGLISDLRR